MARVLTLSPPSLIFAAGLLAASTLAHAGEWDCSPSLLSTHPSEFVLKKSMDAMEQPPEKAVVELEKLAIQFDGWRNQLVLSNQLGPVYMALGRADDARRVYQSILDSGEVPTLIRESARGALAHTLMRLNLNDEIIALYSDPQRPVCTGAESEGLYALARAHAARKDLQASELLIHAHLAKSREETWPNAFLRDWRELGVLTACHLKHEADCVARWEWLVWNWPTRGEDANSRLSRYVPLLKTWKSGQVAIDRAAANGLMMGTRVSNPVSGPPPHLDAMKRGALRYPIAAAERRIKGWVEVEVTVGTDGRAVSATVLRANPAGVFEIASLNSAKDSEFPRKGRDGKPVEYSGLVKYMFGIADYQNEFPEHHGLGRP